MTVTKDVRFRTWKELLKTALKLEKQGYICEVKGFEGMRFNKLTITYNDEKPSQKRRGLQKMMPQAQRSSTQDV